MLYIKVHTRTRHNYMPHTAALGNQLFIHVLHMDPCLLSIGTRVKDGIGKSLVYAILARDPVHVGRENPLQTVCT